MIYLVDKVKIVNVKYNNWPGALWNNNGGDAFGRLDVFNKM